MSKVNTVHLGDHLVDSVGFHRLFTHGMELVEETSRYLDSEGREESKELQPELSLCYATESMKLTTRLIQISSWLLLHRAVAEGEMTQDEANYSKTRLTLEEIGRKPSPEVYASLPVRFVELIEASHRLLECVVHLDRQVLPSAERDLIDAPKTNAVSGHLDKLRQAFS